MVSLFSRARGLRNWTTFLSPRLTSTQNSAPLCPGASHFPVSPRMSTFSWGSSRNLSKALFSTSTNSEVLEKVVDKLDDLNQQQNKLFAVVHISGRQFKITPNDLIVVNQIEADIGDEIHLEKVLLAGSEDITLIGKPLLSDELVRVKATVTEHTKTAKVIVFKKKRRKNYKRKHGHKQPVSVLRINTIDISSQSKLK